MAFGSPSFSAKTKVEIVHGLPSYQAERFACQRVCFTFEVDLFFLSPCKSYHVYNLNLAVFFVGELNSIFYLENYNFCTNQVMVVDQNLKKMS